MTYKKRYFVTELLLSWGKSKVILHHQYIPPRGNVMVFVGTRLIASSARAMQCAVLIMHQSSREIMQERLRMELAQ